MGQNCGSYLLRSRLRFAINKLSVRIDAGGRWAEIWNAKKLTLFVINIHNSAFEIAGWGLNCFHYGKRFDCRLLTTPLHSRCFTFRQTCTCDDNSHMSMELRHNALGHGHECETHMMTTSAHSLGDAFKIINKTFNRIYLGKTV